MLITVDICRYQEKTEEKGRKPKKTEEKGRKQKLTLEKCRIWDKANSTSQFVSVSFSLYHFPYGKNSQKYTKKSSE